MLRAGTKRESKRPAILGVGNPTVQRLLGSKNHKSDGVSSRITKRLGFVGVGQPKVQDYFGIMLGSFWNHVGMILGSFLNHCGYPLGKFL